MQAETNSPTASPEYVVFSMSGASVPAVASGTPDVVFMPRGVGTVGRAETAVMLSPKARMIAQSFARVQV